MQKPTAPTDATTQPLLLRYREAAIALGISRSFLKSLALRGAIPSVRIGTARRFAAAEIERIAQEGLPR
ncbi:MAG: helix-turn-helix domain-containing protein [Vulcanimicrobiaceae bacterium]